MANIIKSNTPCNFSDSSSGIISKENIRGWVEQTLSELCNGLYERDETMAITLLTVISGQSVFLYGPPGTAKSLISRRISCAFSDSSYFEYLMQRFSTPEEVFGPISIKELKNDNYIRVVDKYLPTADIAFLDEIWKSSPAILNTLLTIINERKFKNGNEVMNVPLKAIIAASNEFPPENNGLDALYDRFIVRMCVNPTSDRSNFRKVVSKNNVPSFVKVSHPLTVDEWRSLMDRTEEVIIPDSVFDIIDTIRDDIIAHNGQQNTESIYISDRRWQKALYVVRTAAMLSGRTSVEPTDLLILKHCLWSSLEDKEVLDRIITRCATVHKSSAPTKYKRWLEKFNNDTDTVMDIFDKCGKRNTVMINGIECYSVNVSAHSFLSSKHSTYYIDRNELYREGTYKTVPSNGSPSISYTVLNITANRTTIKIDGETKSIDTTTIQYIGDRRDVEVSLKNIEIRISELKQMINETEHDISRLSSGKISPFIPITDSGGNIDSLKAVRDQMKKSLMDANSMCEKLRQC